MNKHFLRGVVVAVAAAFSVVALPSASHAAANDNTCDYAEVCAFLNSNYGGGMDDIGTTDSSWTNNYYSTGAWAHDSASSGFGMERAEVFFVDTNFAGPYFILGINQYDTLWTTNQPNSSAGDGFNFNDKVDSKE